MRIGIEHTTGFRYLDPVRASYNQARMTPVNTAGQTVWTARLTIDPSPWSYTINDYYGTVVTTFEIHEPHDRMTVRSDCVVDTHPGALTDIMRGQDTDLSWDELRGQKVTDEFAEYLELRSRTEPHPALAELAGQVGDGRSPRQAALELCRLVHDHLTYESGSTQVTATASEVWAGGRGVCQDFSHVTVGALRSVGLPTRYVSGYLHPGDKEGKIHVAVEGESHSWVEFWCGEWQAFDPTAMSQIGDHYVRVGHGRDYGDVPPLRGTYAGGESEMFVKVRLTRLS